MPHLTQTLTLCLILHLAAAHTHAADKPKPNQQQWSIEFTTDTAIIRATPQTNYKFIQGTIKALQDDGIKKFALRAGGKPNTPTNSPLLSISILKQEAEIAASTNTPYKHVKSIISVLTENGVRRIKFAKPTLPKPKDDKTAN